MKGVKAKNSMSESIEERTSTKEGFRFPTPRMAGLLREISRDFLIPEDFPEADREEELLRLRRKVAAAGNRSLRSFAAGLTGRETENLALALFGVGDRQVSGEEAEALLCVLSHRLSDRLIRIIWQLYQANYKNGNPNVPRILMLVAEQTDRQERPVPEAVLLTILSRKGGKDRVVEMLNEYPSPINSFLKEYRFNRKSSLVWSIVRRFLTQCGKEYFPFNEGWLLRIIRHDPTDRLGPLLTHYLSRLSLEEYLEEVNLTVLERMGCPGESSLWDRIPEPVQRRFADWNASRLLAAHLGGKHNSKYRLLSRYLPEVCRIAALRGEELLVLDFERFVIVDEAGVPGYSYLIQRERFDEIREELEYRSVKEYLPEERLPEAREFILDEEESAVLQLNYREVGKLFIIKTLNILLGREMDLRRSKNLLSKSRVFRKRNRFWDESEPEI